MRTQYLDFFRRAVFPWLAGFAVMASACTTNTSNTNKPTAGPKAGEDTKRAGDYLVISMAAKPNTSCKIIPKGNMYAAIYTRSFGPASYQECEAWVKANCKETAAGKGASVR